MGLRRKSLLKEESPKSEEKSSSCQSFSSPTSCSTSPSDNESNNSAIQGCSTATPSSSPSNGTTASKLKEPFYKALQIAISADLESLSQTTEQRVESAKETLSLLEKEVISALFPMSGQTESYEAIATRLGLTMKEVRDLADNALRGLRGSKSRGARISSILN